MYSLYYFLWLPVYEPIDIIDNNLMRTAKREKDWNFEVENIFLKIYIKELDLIHLVFDRPQTSDTY